jgi:hypothetical protein
MQITKAHLDLDANPTFDLADLMDEFNRSRVYSYETKRRLGGIFAQLIEIYVVITDILMVVFLWDDTLGWGRDMNPEDTGRVGECKMALRIWNKVSILRFQMFSGGQTTQQRARRSHQTSHDSVILYTNLTYMYYHSTRVLLCHHEVFHRAMLQAALHCH